MAKRFEGLSEAQIRAVHELAAEADDHPAKQGWKAYHQFRAPTLDALEREGLIETGSFDLYGNGHKHMAVRLTGCGRELAGRYQQQINPGESYAQTRARKKRERELQREHAEHERERRRQLATKLAPLIGRLTGNAGLAEHLSQGHPEISSYSGVRVSIEDLQQLMMTLPPSDAVAEPADPDQGALAGLL